LLAVAGPGSVDGYNDYDKDGLNDYYEFRSGHDPMVDDKNAVTYNEEKGVYEKDLTEYDGDGDGLTLLLEQKNGTDPNVKDDNQGGVVIDDTSDTDDDGISNYAEEHNTVKTGVRDSLSPVVWRALKADGTAAQVLTVKEIDGDRVLGVDSTNAKLTQNWTLETWFLLTDASKNTGSFIKRVGANGTYFDFGLKEGRPYARASMSTSWMENGESTNLLEVCPENGSVIGTDVWVHYAAVWNARQRSLALYLNGTFMGSKYCVSAPLIDGGTVDGFTTTILDDYEGSYLAGYIDDVRIWVDGALGEESHTNRSRTGLRMPRQIKEWMSKALPVTSADLSTYDTNLENTPSAYYRFDDGGKTIQDFAYVLENEIANGWLHSPSGNDIENRMLSSWSDENGDDKTGEYYNSSNVAKRAINMNGGGNSDYDPIPDGWQQLYWPDKFTTGAYDLDLDYLNILRRWNQYDLYGNVAQVIWAPTSFPYESSYFIDPLTGESHENSFVHVGGEREGFLYIGDIFFDEVKDLETVDFSCELAYAACPGTNDPALNEIWVFVNGKRVGFSPDSTGRPGEDVDVRMTTQLAGQEKNGGLAYYASGTAASYPSIHADIKSAMVRGRNRITIRTNHHHAPSSTCTSHNHSYRFWVRIRVNGRTPDNVQDHVRWFVCQQSSSGTTLNHIDYTSPSQEDADHCHAKEADGTDLRYYWFEKNYGILPWAYDQDPDGDGLTNWTEFLANTNPRAKVNGATMMNDGEHDEDSDGLNNLTEQYLRTFPNITDTDDDGVSDYEEVTNNDNPLDSTSKKDAKNMSLYLNGMDIVQIPEVGDVIGQDDLSQWTIEAWIKPQKAANGKKQVIARRTVGRYENAKSEEKDAINYELGLTEEGIPYAGFTVVKDTNEGDGSVKIEPVYTKSKISDGFNKLDDEKWVHIAATFTPLAVSEKDSTITNGKIEIYVNGVLYDTLPNVAEIAPTAFRGVAGLTVGGPLPKEVESATEGRFTGLIDNLAIWSSVRTADEIKATQVNGLNDIIHKSGMFTFNTWKVAVPFLRTNKNLLHAFTFDDGGSTIENYAWQQDWYNGFAHAIQAPLGKTVDDILKEDTGRTDTIQVDTDGDGMPDEWEIQYGLDPEDPSDASADLDGDGLTNYYEFLAGTDPSRESSLQLKNKNGEDKPVTLNDIDWDADCDGLTNYYEQLIGTHPRKEDTDDDGVWDGEEYSIIPDEDGNFTLVKNSSPVHSMNRLMTKDDGTIVNYVNRCLDLGKFQKFSKLVVPQGNDGDLDDLSAWTIETWFRYDCDETDVNGVLFSRQIGTKTGFKLGLKNAVPYIKYTTERGQVFGKEYKAPVKKNEWTHLAATWNPETRKLMLIVNGSSAITYEHSKSSVDYLPANGMGTITIAEADNETGWANGIYMDEVRIWNVARTIRQIGEQMDELIQSGTSGLVRYYRFDDGGLSIEDFAHPGWKNEDAYAIKASEYYENIPNEHVLNGTVEWVTDGTFDTPAIRGIDDDDGDGLPDWLE
jgi:hypothetical protein